MHQDIADKLRALLCESLDVSPEQVTPQASLFDDLNADSLDLAHLALQVEEQFSVSIPDADFNRLARFDGAVEYIEECLRAQTESGAAATSEPLVPSERAER